MGCGAECLAHIRRRWTGMCNQLQHRSDVSNKLASDFSEIPAETIIIHDEWNKIIIFLCLRVDKKFPSLQIIQNVLVLSANDNNFYLYKNIFTSNFTFNLMR